MLLWVHHWNLVSVENWTFVSLCFIWAENFHESLSSKFFFQEVGRIQENKNIRIDSDKFNFNFILSALRYRSIVRVQVYRSSCQAGEIGFISKVLLSFYDEIPNKIIKTKNAAPISQFCRPSREFIDILKETIEIHRFSTIVFLGANLCLPGTSFLWICIFSRDPGLKKDKEFTRL